MLDNPDDQANKEVPLDFQKDLMDDIPMPSSLKPQSNTEKTENTAEKSASAAQSKAVESSTDVENDPSDDEVGVPPEKADSVLIAELKKEIQDIKNMTPPDSLPTEPVQKKDVQPAQKATADMKINSAEDRKFYSDNFRAIMAFKKVYPYVQKTKDIVTRMNIQLAKVKDNSERRKLIKQTEKELFAQFEKDVRSMSTSQGKLLLKLIARETNQTAYGLIKTYKGAIPATFWYGVGLFFHENLKMQYDSLGEDAQLEKIVQKYKTGKLL